LYAYFAKPEAEKLGMMHMDLSVLHVLICPEIIGREIHLETIERVLAQTRTWQGEMLLRSGEAGWGKSCLVAELKIRSAQPTDLGAICSLLFDAVRYRTQTKTGGTRPQAHPSSGLVAEVRALYPEFSFPD